MSPHKLVHLETRLILHDVDPLSPMYVCMYVCSLLSLALFAKEHNCVRPELTDDSVIYIKAGRWADSI